MSQAANKVTTGGFLHLFKMQGSPPLPSQGLCQAGLACSGRSAQYERIVVWLSSNRLRSQSTNQCVFWTGDERVTLSDGQLVIVPAGRKHGFSNVGAGVLHIRSTLASPVFEAAYDDKRETPRRWLPA